MGAAGWCIDGDRVMWEVLDGEVVIIDLASGHYHAAAGVAATAWQAVAAGEDRDGIVAAVHRRHSEVPADAADHVGRFVDGLVAAGLVTPADGPPSSPAPGAAAAVGTPTPWSPPALESHDDLEDLLLLDPVHDVATTGWPHAAPVDD